MSPGFFLCFFFLSSQLWEDVLSKMKKKIFQRSICAFGEGGGRGNDFTLERLEVFEILAPWVTAISGFKHQKESSLQIYKGHRYPAVRLTHPQTFFWFHLVPLFAVSLNTRRDLLVFFFLSRVALIPAQLTGFLCAKDSTFPFSRVRQNSCREIVDSHAVSMDRGEQHLNHTHLERLWTVLQPLAKAAIVFYLCKRMWGRPLDPQKNTDKICGGWILGAQIIGLCNLKK